LAQKGARVVREAGELIGEALKVLGFNPYFALTLDLASGFTEESLGASTFSADPRVVADCGASFVEGLSRHKILAWGVSRTRAKARDAVPKMGVGLSEPTCRSGLQTARCCGVQKAWW